MHNVQKLSSTFKILSAFTERTVDHFWALYIKGLKIYLVNVKQTIPKGYFP